MSEGAKGLGITHGLPALVVNGDALGPQEALRLWKEAIARLRANLDAEPSEDVQIHLSAWLIGSAILCRSRCSAATLSRGAEQRIEGAQGHVTLIHVVSGEWAGEAGGRSVSLQAGDILCLESSQTFRLSHSPAHYLALVIPREALSALMARMPALHGEILSSPSARVLAAHLGALARHAPALSPEEAARLGRGTLGLAAAALCEIDERHLGDPEPMAPTLRLRVERHIEQNLSSNGLTPEAISRELGIARASLYRAFTSLGGISTYIQTRRLDTACALLLHPEEHRSMGELAEALGFETTASFSKAFRRRFGCSPREARSRGLPTLGNARATFEALLQLMPQTPLPDGETQPTPSIG